MKCLRFPRFLAAMAISAMLFTAWAVAKETPADVATTPAPRPDDWWKQRQQAVNARVKQGHVDLVFLGDSITEGWGKNAAWKKHFEPLKAANFGIGGDRTEHVLWRIENGELDGVTPKAIVLLIGTNNLPANTTYTANTVEETFNGVKAIVDKLKEKEPQAHILLLAVFPREDKPLTDKIAELNGMIAKLDDGKQVKFLNINDKFVDSDGKLLPGVMGRDKLHPAAKGYDLWAEAIRPTLTEWLGPQAAGK